MASMSHGSGSHGRDQAGVGSARDAAGGHGGHLPRTNDTRALVISGWLTGLYFVFELAIGLWTGSVAVTSDAFHTFSAVGGVLIALAAGRLGRRGATRGQTFGYGRAEIVGALFNGLFLVLMAGVVLWMGWMRLRMPMPHLATGAMLLAATGGVVTELVSLWLLYRGQKGDVNIRGAFWHVVQTFVGSLIIVVSALVIRFTGYVKIDPILGMAFGVVLLWASWGIIRETLRILMQGTPTDLDLDALVSALVGLEGVENVHHVHAWSLTTGRNVFTGHLRVRDGANPDEVRRRAQALLRDRFGIYFSTLQTERACADVHGEREQAPEIDLIRAVAGG